MRKREKPKKEINLFPRNIPEEESSQGKGYVKGQCVDRTNMHELSINKFKRSFLCIKGVRIWKISSVRTKIFILRWGFTNLMERDYARIYSKKDFNLMVQIFQYTVFRFWPWFHLMQVTFVWVRSWYPPQRYFIAQIWHQSLGLNKQMSSYDRCDSGKN